MIILGIDPGPEKSAWLVYDTEKQKIQFADILDNQHIIHSLIVPRIKLSDRFDAVVVEYILNTFTSTHFVGADIMMTQWWAARFYQAAQPISHYFHRKQIVTALCGSAIANDADVRAVLLDRFPKTGGGKTPQIGTKKKPGPLYGIKRDLWSALAICIAYVDSLAIPSSEQGKEADR